MVSGGNRISLESRGVLFAILLALSGLLTVTTAERAAADVVLKAGTQVSTQQGANCFSSFVTPSYSQQTSAQGNLTGIEPRVGDVFYLSLRVDFISSFDCAADFFSANATLPPNLQPAVGGSAVTICRRWGENSAAIRVFDARAQANCVANPSFNAANRVLSLRPIASPALPDVGGPAASYWFTGIRWPQESQEYPSVQLLVPVKATAMIANQPVQFQVCTVGTDCVTATVNLTATGAPVNADPPFVSLPGEPQVSAVGARLPFSINDNAGDQYYLKVDTSTNPAFPPSTGVGRPCGLTDAVIYQSAGPPPAPFTGQTTSEIQYGDLQTGGTTCYLAPQTTYHVKVCSVSLALADLNCRFTSFTTGAVNVTMELPSTDPQPGTALNALTRVLNGHPSGNTKVQRRFTAVGGGFVDASGNQAIGVATTSTSPASQAVTLPDAWRSYDLRACFVAAQTACTTSVRYVSGAAHSVGDATEVTARAAKLAGRASTPHPSGALSIRIGASDPGGSSPVTSLVEAASTPLGDDPSNIEASATELAVTGLSPSTRYWWAACFDNPVDPGIEDCGAVRTFVTLPGAGPPKAVVRVIRPRTVGLRPGRSTVVSVRLRNAGKARASGVRLCASIPRRLRKSLSVPACTAAGSIAPGAIRKVKLRIVVSRRASSGRVTVPLRVSWRGGRSSAVARFKLLRR